MDSLAFDRLARAVATGGTRRRLFAVLAALPLGGAVLGSNDAEAEHPNQRLGRRNKQRKRKQRNSNQHNNNGNNGKNKNKKNNGNLGGSQCGTTDSDCTQDSDCCSNNCFNLGCADKVHSCGSGASAKACHPAANGCAGETCCYGAAACNEGCCTGMANQCNLQGACCAPNCSGRLCGPDGCGGGGTCGTCPSGTTCDETTGRCPQPGCDVCPTCTYTTVQAAVNDPNGPTTIRICPGIYTESIYITRSLALIGAGQGDGPVDTILRWPGDGSVVVIDVGVAAVTLQALRITDAATGGAVYSSATTLTMTDCTVTGNTGSVCGGIIANGALIMTGCTISDNHAVGDPVVGGGLSLSLQGESTLTNCLVSGNTAQGTDRTRSFGGGIYVGPGPDLTLTLTNTRVTGNITNGDGGGIYRELGGGPVTLQNGSSVTGNTPNNCAGDDIEGCSG